MHIISYFIILFPIVKDHIVEASCALVLRAASVLLFCNLLLCFCSTTCFCALALQLASVLIFSFVLANSPNWRLPYTDFSSLFSKAIGYPVILVFPYNAILFAVSATSHFGRIATTFYTEAFLRKYWLSSRFQYCPIT